MAASLRAGMALCALSGLGACAELGDDERASEAADERASQPADEPELSVRTQALNGGATLTGNCEGQDTRIRNAVALAGLFVPDYVMRRCLAKGIYTYADNTYPELVHAQIAANRVTNIECVNPIMHNGVATDFAGYGLVRPDGTESIKMNPARLAVLTDEQVLGIVVHEVTHNRGYGHPMQPDRSEYNETVPMQTDSCVRAINRNSTEPGGRSRYSMAQETTLAPAGGGGGYPFDRMCGANEWAAGLAVRAGTLIDAVGIRCRNATTTIKQAWSTVGGGGGSAANLDCPAGEALVGVYGNADVLNTRLGPICALTSDISNGLTGPNSGDPRFPGEKLHYGATRGTAVGPAYERVCPQHMVVRALRGRAASVLDRLELFCQRLDWLEGITNTYLPRSGGDGGSAYTETCVGRSALVGLNFEGNGNVTRLGGACSELVRSCGTSTCTHSINSARHVLPGHGGSMQNSAFELEDRCAPGSALVGLTIRAGLVIDAVGGICASVFNWTAPTRPPAPTTNLSLRGGTGGTTVTHMCPRGQLLTGWSIRAGNLVDGLAPICRVF